MYHPETAYEFGKKRQLEIERAAHEGSVVFAWLGRLVQTARRRRQDER